MMTREAQEENEKKDEAAFVDELAKLMTKYRPLVRCGLLIGAMEVVKLRLFAETSQHVDKKMSKSDDTVPQTSIRCPQCGMVSYNQNDIKERYCGHCHEWHQNMKGQK